MWILKWANSNRLLALVIVALFLVASASAVDSYSRRKEVRRLNTALGIQEKALLAEKEKELKEAEDVWLRSLSASDAKLEPVLRERDALRKRLAQVAGAPFVPPAGDEEVVARWKDLGYAVRVAPCK
jgi:hypothetical protein